MKGYTLYITTGFFPYAVKSDDPQAFIWGELLWPRSDEIAGSLTRKFDGIEGHPSHYTRTEVDVWRNSKSSERAWMYAVTLDRITFSVEKPREIGASWRSYVSACEKQDAAARQRLLTSTP
jgi:hypothetical protein